MVNRQLEMVYILMNKGSVTAEELAERFEVSTRTVYRDIDSLSMAGIPVYANRGKGGGIRLMEHFVLDRRLLSKEEQGRILAALASLRETGFSGHKDSGEAGDFLQGRASGLGGHRLLRLERQAGGAVRADQGSHPGAACDGL